MYITACDPSHIAKRMLSCPQLEAEKAISESLKNDLQRAEHSIAEVQEKCGKEEARVLDYR